jgi:multiple sugar transport system ATP-binding protein
MNMIKGIAEKTHVLTADGVKLPLPKTHKAKAGQEVIYGIRPEDLDVGKGFPAKISVTEPTGPEIHVYADLGDDEICAIVRERQEFKRDSIVEFAPRLDKVHLFDAKTTMAIR